VKVKVFPDVCAGAEVGETLTVPPPFGPYTVATPTELSAEVPGVFVVAVTFG
jgi:hypothetical protein